MPSYRPLADRFWGKITTIGDVPAHRPELGPCWIWTASIGTHGYGVIGIGPTKTETSNRVAWKIQFGSIPDGKWVLHHCDNRTCVRGSHLFLGTPKENTQDCIRKGRNPRSVPIMKTHCMAGHPMAGENLRTYKNSRFCRSCQKEKSSAFYNKYGYRKTRV